MLEELALSVSTVIFILCTLILDSIIPEAHANIEDASVKLEYSDTSGESEDGFTLLGSWEACGFSYEFTQSGKLLCEDSVMEWSLDGDIVTIIRDDGRSYEMLLEPLGERVMTLGGITMYKIESAKQ